MTVNKLSEMLALCLVGFCIFVVHCQMFGKIIVVDTEIELTEDYIILNGSSGPVPNHHGSAMAEIISGGDLCGYVSGIEPVLQSAAIVTREHAVASLLDKLRLYGPDADMSANSWGATDNGVYHLPEWTVVSEERYRQETRRGRGGKGLVNVWAAGNGGVDDSCVHDYCSQSTENIVVTMISDATRIDWYAENCPSVLFAVVKPKGGIKMDGKCHRFPTGSSPGCALAVNIVFKMLQANPALTYQDVQTALVEASSFPDTMDAVSVVNGAGRRFNDRIGFGLVDADKALAASAGLNSEPWVACVVGSIDSPVVDAGCLVDTIRWISVRITLTPTSAWQDASLSFSTGETANVTLLSKRPADESASTREMLLNVNRFWGEKFNGVDDWVFEASSFIVHSSQVTVIGQS